MVSGSGDVRNTYVIYYGWLAGDARGEPNEAARAIAAAAAPLLIANFWTAAPARHRNLSAAVLSLLHEAGTQVYAYVPTGFGSADPGALESEIGECLDAGADGVFLDEVDPLLSGSKARYYARLARGVRNRGGGVIANAGVAACGERIMEIADRLMVEHRWRALVAASPWVCRYAPDRLMGVSSNERGAMGYDMDIATALRDTREAWGAGVGWHTSTERYIALPAWFSAYMAALKA